MDRGGSSIDLLIMYDIDRYEFIKEISSGNFDIVRMMGKTKELIVIKYINRGKKIDKNVQQEIINHYSLKHLNIVQFKEVILTPIHLAIIMAYAIGGKHFKHIYNAGHFSEDEAYYFRNLVSNSACHSMKICHHDLKLENTLFDGIPTPHLKIYDFCYSKSYLLHY
eukprot:Gb_18878 [translate_table: standard]